jgi:hypothetical protein
MAPDKPSTPVARRQRLLDESRAEGVGQPDTEHDGKAAYLVLQRDPLADQLLARDDQRSNGVRRQ